MWKLKWFYFDALEVIYKEAPGCTKAHARAVAAYNYFGDSLRDANSLGDIESAAFARVGTEPLLIGLSRSALDKAVAEAGPMRYPWPTDAWPTDFAYYDRDDPYGDGADIAYDAVFIDADVVYLPWPLPILLKNGADVTKLATFLGVSTKNVPASAVSTSTMMRAFDGAYAENPEPASRAQFESLAEPKRGSSLVTEASSAYGRDLRIPAGFDLPFGRELPVGPLDTNESYFEWTGSTLQFVMGLNNPPAAGLGAEPVMLERVPCGALASK